MKPENSHIKADSSIHSQAMPEALLGSPAYKELGMRILKLPDKSLYDKHISNTNFPVDIWSSNFAYLWAYTRTPDKMTIMHSVIDGLLITWILTSKGRLYLPCLPVGAGGLTEVVDILIHCANYCHDWNRNSGFGHKPVLAKMSSNQLAYFQKSDNFNITFEPLLLSGVERHLSIKGLTTLTGKKFSTIRYKLNKFQRDFPNAIVRLYQPDDFTGVVSLSQQWKESAGNRHRRILDSFYFEATIKHYQALGLENLVVDMNGRIIGVTVGGLLPTGDAWGYLTKYNGNYEGLSDYLIIAMVRRIHELEPKTELINVGTDFGNSRLAMAKEKFRPVKTYQRFALSMR